jgi:cytochrome c551/c552
MPGKSIHMKPTCIYQNLRVGLASACLVWAGASGAQTTMTGSELATSKGCYNCHGSYLRGDAPGFERLSARLGGLKGDATAERKFTDSFRAGELLQHIDAHERLSNESATALIHWLAEGAK